MSTEVANAPYVNPFQDIAKRWKEAYFTQLSLTATLRESHTKASEILELVALLGDTTGNLPEVLEHIRRLSRSLKQYAEVGVNASESTAS